MSTYGIVSYGIVGFRLLFVAHGHDGDHQVDEIEGAEEDDNGKKYHMHWSACGNDLKNMVIVWSVIMFSFS